MQAQDAQVFGRNSKPDAPPFEDTFDLRMAYADIGQTGKSPVLVRVGRQELAFGEQRLVGHANWVNTARTFDAARVTVARKTFKIDGFASSVVTMRDGDFNRSRQGESFYGAYSAFTAIVPAATLEPYVLARNVRTATAESGMPGRLESVTVGARWLGTLPAGFDYNTEMALQRGSLASDDISAWAGHWLVGRTAGTRAALRLSGEYNYASGDSDPKDGRRNTFDQLYPTAHDKYGLADQVGWRNIHHLRTALDVKPSPKWTISGSYHSWWLASTTDGLYAASGGVLVRPVAGLHRQPRRSGARRADDVPAVAASAGVRRVRLHHPGRVSEGRDAGEGLQLSLCDGDVHDPERRPMNPTSRREFLKRSALASLTAGLPSGWAGTAYADDSPETANVRFGMIALTDCAPIVMAHELGYFKKFGISSVVSKEASWAVIRDKMNIGENQATHMLLGMPLASTMGLAGSPVKPMVIPWLLNRNGQAITLNNKLKQAGVRTATALKPHVDKAKAAGDPMSFAMTFPPGTHAMWMRYWLASGGIHPDKDVNLITIPPPQMVANMKVDKMDGFCVGEPWNKRAIADGIGFTAITTQQIWKDHPEKVCAFTEEFAGRNPKTVKADPEGAAPGERVSRQDGEPSDRGGSHLAADLHQLSAGDHPRAPARQVRLRRRPGRTGSELHDLLATAVQLPAPGVRRLVAHAVQALGHGQGDAGLPGRRQARCCGRTCISTR